MITTTEPYFDFILRKNAPGILIFPYRLSEPEKSAFIFDARDTAYLRRDFDELIILKDMPRDVLDFLRTSPNIFVVELDKRREVAYKYGVKVQVDKNAKHKIERVFRVRI